MTLLRRLFLGLPALLLALGALAQPAEPQPAEAPAATPQPETAARLQPNQVPRLVVRWSCESCVANDKVAALIEASYAQEATRNGQTVSSAETAEATVVEYRQRPPAKRAMFGAFAGRDSLTIHVVFRGAGFDAHDYSANIMFGMNSLCEVVGKKAYEQISAGLRTP